MLGASPPALFKLWSATAPDKRFGGAPAETAADLGPAVRISATEISPPKHVHHKFYKNKKNRNYIDLLQ
jgi:hypothetical protein